MSGEHMERNLPSTSEATPPEIGDQPLTPEERVVSSTDCHPTIVPDPSTQPSVSSIPQQGSSFMGLLVDPNQPHRPNLGKLAMATDETAQTTPEVVQKPSYLFPASASKEEFKKRKSGSETDEKAALADEPVDIKTSRAEEEAKFFRPIWAPTPHEIMLVPLEKLDEVANKGNLVLSVGKTCASVCVFKAPDDAIEPTEEFKRILKCLEEFKLGIPAKDQSKSKSGSETDEKAASAAEPVAPDAKSASSDKKSTKKLDRPKKVTSPGSETEKLLTSSTEDTDAPRKSERETPEKK